MHYESTSIDTCIRTPQSSCIVNVWHSLVFQIVDTSYFCDYFFPISPENKAKITVCICVRCAFNFIENNYVSRIELLIKSENVEKLIYKTNVRRAYDSNGTSL